MTTLLQRIVGPVEPAQRAQDVVYLGGVGFIWECVCGMSGRLGWQTRRLARRDSTGHECPPETYAGKHRVRGHARHRAAVSR